MSTDLPVSEGAAVALPSGELMSRVTGPIRWLADPAIAPFLHVLIQRPQAFFDPPAHASLIKGGGRRIVYSCSVGGFDGRLLVKVYKPASIWDRLRDLFLRPQAIQEFEVATALARASIKVARPLAAGRAWQGGLPNGSVLVTRFVEGATTVMDLLKSGEQGDELVAAVASCFADLHSAGFYHPDLHLGNVLASRSGGPLEALLVDLHSVLPGTRANRSHFVENLAHARNSFTAGKPRLFARFVAEYARQRGLSRAEGRELAREAYDRADALLFSFWKRRTARCLKESSGFSISRSRGARVFCAAGFDAAAALSAIDAYRAGSGRLLKDGAKTRIAAGLDAAGGKVVVKEYKAGGVFGALATVAGAGRARRAWVGGNGLLARGAGAARPLALVERASGPSFVVMEDLSAARELDRHVTGPANSKPSDLRLIASELGNFVGLLHRKGIFHADLKTCNILVLQPGGARPEFALLDHDRVSFGSEVAARLKVRNLVQLDTSIPGSVSRATRARFLKAYLRACPFQGGAAALAAQVLYGSAGRDVIYVTEDGDVIERKKK